MMKQYLLLFVQHRSNFRRAELVSLLDLAGITNYKIDFFDEQEPYATVWFEDDATVRKAVARSILVRVVLDTYAMGSTYEEVGSQLEKRRAELRDAFSEAQTFKFEVETYGRQLFQQERLDRMQRVGEHIDQVGKVQLIQPNLKVWIWENYAIATVPPAEPKLIVVGREVAIGSRHLVDKFNLRKRAYIGPTSMDNELSLLCANIAQASEQSFVYDPFCGTGSLLVAAAHFGAMTMGGDRDPRVIRGKTSTNPRSNFEQYEMRMPELIICDGAMRNFPENRTFFDAIITDPPYGVRAGARKIGVGQKKEVKAIPPEYRKTHHPRTIPYHMKEILNDLLTLAARAIHLGGRLVYWLPHKPDFQFDQLPQHPCFKPVAAVRQLLGRRWHRSLIGMEKVQEYSPDMEAIIPDIDFEFKDDDDDDDDNDENGDDTSSKQSAAAASTSLQ